MDGNILVTGGCGFVGSNIAISLKKDFPDSGVIALDNLRRRGSELNIERLKENGVRFVHGDVRNREDLAELTGISLIIDAAADPSVLAGIGSTPDYVINSNLLGTINCLNLAVKNNSGIIFLSTSRIYPIGLLNRIKYNEDENRFSLAKEQSLPGVSVKGISEEFGIAGARSLYGASKLASELFIQEYAEFYGLKAIINRCGVIAGPWQFGKVDQGVVVLWLMRHYFKRELNYIGFGGSGRQVRDILHVNDLCRLIRIQLMNFEKFSGEIFNVGGGMGVSASLKELTLICEKITGNTIRINSIPETRTADIPVYITDNSKVTAATGWMPEIPVEKIVEDIYLWIRSNESSLIKILE